MASYGVAKWHENMGFTGKSTWQRNVLIAHPHNKRLFHKSLRGCFE